MINWIYFSRLFCIFIWMINDNVLFLCAGIKLNCIDLNVQGIHSTWHNLPNDMKMIQNDVIRSWNFNDFFMSFFTESTINQSPFNSWRIEYWSFFIRTDYLPSIPNLSNSKQNVMLFCTKKKLVRFKFFLLYMRERTKKKKRF